MRRPVAANPSVPLKVNRLLPVGVVAEIAKCAAIEVGANTARDRGLITVTIEGEERRAGRKLGSDG